MPNSETSYIILCKNLIEEKLGWANSQEWKQRDYLNLIDLLENKTGISLSLSTLKRIWKPDYVGRPHPSTLEAFAQFLDYKNWLDFKEQHPPKTPSTKLKRWNSLRPKNLVLFLSPLILLLGVLGGFLLSSKVEKEVPTIFAPLDKVKFSCNNSVSSGVPNTVIFNYDLREAVADSFFIQQSWNQFRRDKISPQDSTLTSVYYYPGVHKAKLIANDSTLKETTLRVHTDDWLSLVRQGFMDVIPTYIRDPLLYKEGILKVGLEHLKANQIDINDQTIVSYYYVNDFTGLSSGNFSLKTRFKCDSILNLNCPWVYIIVLAEHNIHSIPLTIKGCVGNLSVKLGEQIINGKNQDLSALGTQVYEWQTLYLVVEDKQAKIYLNETLILETTFAEEMGDIVGFNINFSGTGSIDYLNYYDPAVGHTDSLLD